jgi:ATP-dependent DNA helicase RecG
VAALICRDVILMKQTLITTLRGVGPSSTEKLEKLGIFTVQDLLFHLPLRYQDRTRIVPLSQLRPGDQVAVEGEIHITQVVIRGRRALIVGISDKRSILYLRFFHFSQAQQKTFQEGRRIQCFGEVRLTKQGLEMIHPEYHFVSNDHQNAVEKSLTPVYPVTEGLHQLSFRKLMLQALGLLRNDLALDELIPEKYLSQYHFPSLKTALLFLHQPPPEVRIDLIAQGQHPAQQRLAFEELLAHHLSLRRLRQNIKKNQAVCLADSANIEFKALENRFLNNLSFQLTQAQKRVTQEIADDLVKAEPMLRLVQGDVGSGKTVVAAISALRAIALNYQVALMAPTELLAEQHYRNFHYWFEPLKIPLIYLSGSIKGKKRTEALEKIKNGEAKMIIGTHALFQKEVVFNHLVVVIVDEQHRFGVHQRLALREKGGKQQYFPHQLMMTATPIPRTLAMSAYADLDCSVIDELPPGRIPIKTVVIANTRRDEVVERIRLACQEQRQVYWVCTLIEESEVLQAEAAEKTAEYLIKVLPELTIELIHGRMNATEKELKMKAFKNHDIDLLVATTVIEVGVDVPNASLMVIENAERLGLSQLHQLRGRVGRGTVESHCVLLYQNPLGSIAKMRLETMRETGDGFKIAEKDLELRGPGEVLGTRQTGIAQLRIADLIRDRELLPKIQLLSEELLRDYPEKVELLLKRWLMEQAEEFAEV